MPAFEAEPDNREGLSFSDLELNTALAEMEHEARSAAFTQVFDNLKRLNPTKVPCRLFEGFKEGVISRNVLIISHERQRKQPRSTRVIVCDEKMSDSDLTMRVIESQEFVVRRLGHLIDERKSVVPIGSPRIEGDGFRIRRPSPDSDIVKIDHGIEYYAEPVVDQPFASEAELQRRRMAAERLVSILDPLRLQDSIETGYLFRFCG